MGLLEQLGLGGVFGSYPPEMTFQNHYNQHLKYLRQHDYISQCIHPNCPICAEETKKAQELKIKQEKIVEQKKLDYKNRCKNYMEKFRRKSKWK